MLFRRFHQEGLAQASYLIACERSKEAIIVDPVRDPAPYLEAARREGVRVTLVTETHVHADFVSGAPSLAAAAGAELLLSGAGESQAAYRREAYPRARWVVDGDVLRLGAVRLDVMHVPGHTPEHLAFLVTDESTSAEPVGMLSGDFLFVGDVGRPDLLERAMGRAGTMERSARELFTSLQRVRHLPEFVQLWPGHGAGSACGKTLGALPQSTIGYELRTNWAFRVTDELSFAEQVLSGQPEPPRYFSRMKRLNADGGLPRTSGPADVNTEAKTAREALARGARVVDIRTPAEFARGHVPHSFNIPFGKSFLDWAGAVLDPDDDIVLLTTASARQDALDAARALTLIGIDGVRGVMALEDVPASDDRPFVRLPIVPAASIGAAAPQETTVLDVRRRSEWDEGHVPGARHIPLAELTTRLDELRGAGPLLVHCQGGSRSAVAASVLRASGFDEVSNVEGGYAAWARMGHVPSTGD